jgi:hypothetical protein
MCTRSIAAVAAIGLALSASAVLAQCNCGPVEAGYVGSVPSYTTYYAPSVTYYAPVPYVSYYAPAPYVSYRAPVVPYVAYYSPYVAYRAPLVRPYAAYDGVGGWGVYGRPRIYVPGVPVRRAVGVVVW